LYRTRQSRGGLALVTISGFGNMDLAVQRAPANAPGQKLASALPCSRLYAAGFSRSSFDLRLVRRLAAAMARLVSVGLTSIA